MPILKVIISKNELNKDRIGIVLKVENHIITYYVCRTNEFN